MEIWILSTLSFFIGYFIGSGKKPKEEYDRMVNTIKKSTIKAGVITRPSPETVILRSHPKEMEAQEAFKKSFVKDIGDPTV